jgi:hypothetical protein
LLSAARDRLGIASAIGLASFLLFNWWWLPVEPELAIVPTAFCVIILALALAIVMRWSRRPRRLMGVAWMALCALAGVNALGNAEFRAMIRPEKLALAERLAALNRDNCLTLDEYVVTGAVTYFTGQRAADVRRVLRSLSQENAPPPPVAQAPCLLVRAHWLEADSSAARALFARDTTPASVSAWRVESQDDAQAGRVLRIRRAEAVDMAPDQFRDFVGAALRGP